MKKPTSARRQTEARARQRAHGTSLRGWLEDRAADLRKRRAAAAAKASESEQPSRGVDRVPARFRTVPRDREWVYQHGGHPRAPYTNPARDAKSLRAGRLRKELQR